MTKMSHKFLQIICLFLVLICAAVVSQFPDEDARPLVAEVDAAKYAGRWYPVYGNVIEMQVYLKDDYCPLNDFTYISERAAEGNNTVRVGAVNGTLVYTSPALLVYGNEPQGGNATYIFFGIGAMQYYISKLGPDTFGDDNLYQYAVVWSPNFFNSFIIARDAQDFKETYREEVFDWMRLNGFDGWFWNVENGEIYQESDCEYPPVPEAN